MIQVHAHEVIHMMLNSGKTYTQASLLTDIITHFGPDARFYACSAQNLSPEALVDFLRAKGKFVPCDEGFQTSPDLMCKH